MWTVCFYVVTIVPLSLIDAESHIHYDTTNGWIPVSSETIYNQIRREEVQTPHYSPSQIIQALHTDINKILSLQNVLKSTEGERIELVRNVQDADNNCNPGGLNNCKEDKIKNTSEKSEHVRYDLISHNTSSNQSETEFPIQRRSKKIADYTSTDNTIKQSQRLFFVAIPKSKEKSYEVTENIVEQEDINTNYEGYKYDPPKSNETKGLYEILSKYKINKYDELPNYALSRKPKAQISFNQNLFVKPIHNQISGYNNLNNLPVDPILAVFLSNYGFYLQGMYGRNNRYNNLYGYLASNNIHNNRPFGTYKMFSDTDSSH